MNVRLLTTEVTENTELNIYNIKGQRVKSFKIHPDIYRDEIYLVVWDGTDNNHNQVSSGIYLYRLIDAGNVLASQKMILLK